MDLGDKRLNQRAVKLVEKLAAQPMASIPAACGGWSETSAAYRFFSQEDVSWQDILAPHWQRTQEYGRAGVMGAGVRSCIPTLMLQTPYVASSSY